MTIPFPKLGKATVDDKLAETPGNLDKLKIDFNSTVGTKSHFL